jgi:hypothetical protein
MPATRWTSTIGRPFPVQPAEFRAPASGYVEKPP